MNVEIIDTTLRDGEQAPGVFFSIDQKWEIVNRLFDLGVDEVEAGIPVSGNDSICFITDLVRNYRNKNISAWSRFKISDLKVCKDTGAEIVHISIPVSKYHLKNQLGSWNTLIAEFNTVIGYAKENFRLVSIGLQDSFRTDRKRLIDLCSMSDFYGVDRIRFSDTVGSSFPGEVGSFIKNYRGYYSGKIDFHGHNDLGLASANSLAALEAGADSINVTINGIGERAGNTSLEQMAFILDQHKGFTTNLDIKKIKPLAVDVSKFINRPIPLDCPLVGENVFTHESGIHCNGILKNPLAYQPFNPEDKGLNKTNLVVGTHSGRSNVINILESAGIHSFDKDITKIMNAFKVSAAKKKNFLTSEEVISIYKEQTGGV